ncbi:MAG TPA: hypothetical protein VF947_05620, partial [Myxococcales bacterium]
DAPAAGPSQPVPTEQIDPKSDGREAQNPADGSPSVQPADQPAPDRPTAPRPKLPADDKP